MPNITTVQGNGEDVCPICGEILDVSTATFDEQEVIVRNVSCPGCGVVIEGRTEREGRLEPCPQCGGEDLFMMRSTATNPRLRPTVAIRCCGCGRGEIVISPPGSSLTMGQLVDLALYRWERG